MSCHKPPDLPTPRVKRGTGNYRAEPARARSPGRSGHGARRPESARLARGLSGHRPPGGLPNPQPGAHCDKNVPVKAILQKHRTVLPRTVWVIKDKDSQKLSPPRGASGHSTERNSGPGWGPGTGKDIRQKPRKRAGGQTLVDTMCPRRFTACDNVSCGGKTLTTGNLLWVFGNFLS